MPEFSIWSYVQMPDAEPRTFVEAGRRWRNELLRHLTTDARGPGYSCEQQDHRGCWAFFICSTCRGGAAGWSAPLRQPAPPPYRGGQVEMAQQPSRKTKLPRAIDDMRCGRSRIRLGMASPVT